IDQAAVFVPDLTFIGQRPDGRSTPNPNVLIEYGWALKSLGHSRIVPVMNTAFGQPSPDSMPFDLRHLRHPITYHCPVDLNDDARKETRQQLAKELEFAIRLVLDDPELSKRLNPEGPPPFVERRPVSGQSRFKRPEDPIGLTRDLVRAPRQIRLSAEPSC